MTVASSRSLIFSAGFIPGPFIGLFPTEHQHVLYRFDFTQSQRGHTFSLVVLSTACTLSAGRKCRFIFHNILRFNEILRQVVCDEE
jgi:hypothetical protein